MEGEGDEIEKQSTSKFTTKTYNKVRWIDKEENKSLAIKIPNIKAKKTKMFDYKTDEGTDTKSPSKGVRLFHLTEKSIPVSADVSDDTSSVGRSSTVSLIPGRMKDFSIKSKFTSRNLDNLVSKRGQTFSSYFTTKTNRMFDSPRSSAKKAFGHTRHEIYSKGDDPVVISQKNIYGVKKAPGHIRKFAKNKYKAPVNTEMYEYQKLEQKEFEKMRERMSHTKNYYVSRKDILARR